MASLKPMLTLALDLLYPPQCSSCRIPVAAEGNFCSDCYSKLRMISHPVCDCCGIPFAIPVPEGTQCPECLVELPAFAKARAALVYDAISAPLITSFKFHDQQSGLPRYVSWMLNAAKPTLENVELIVPVPLHWRRLFKRRYNQSALFAYSVAKQIGVPCDVTVLKRVQYTRPQMRLDRKTRLQNVTKAFAVANAASIHGKTVLLVDDVVTTGATANACAKALLKAGAKEVRVLSLARTVKE
jgi:ComF family protein